RDQRLLDAVQQVARERDALSDPRWDALAKGTLSEEDEAVLREEAARSPAMAEAYELFRPFDAATKEAMIARVLAANPVVPKARRWWRAGATLAAAVVAALLVRFIIFPPGRPPPEPIPAYAIFVDGGEKPMLGAEDDAGAPHVLQDPESRLDVKLAPDTSVEGAIDVRAWLVRD